MRKLLIILFCLISFTVSAQDTYYVATDGDNGDSGDLTHPWATWTYAITQVVAGDTVYFRGGTYNMTSPVSINAIAGETGTRAAPIHYYNYTGEVPIFNFSGYHETGHTSFSAIGISHVQFIKFRGITVCYLEQTESDNMPQGFGTAYSANLTFENCVSHDIGGRGFWHLSGFWNAWDSGLSPDWDSDSTYFINCDAYNICDSLSVNPGNAGDCWKAHCYQNGLISFSGCRAWNYSDDGFDISGQGHRLFDRCWMMPGAKYVEYVIEGNGIKCTAPEIMYLSDPLLPDTNLIRITNSIAAYCNGSGGLGFMPNLYINNTTYESANPLVYNNLAYKCDAGFGESNNFDSPRDSWYKNNIAYASIDLPTYLVQIYRPSIYTESNNNWDATQYEEGWPGWEYASDMTVSDADFVSLDTSLLTGARQVDGSLPNITFGHLVVGSDLIDAGVYVGLPFNGVAPDIGAFEYGKPLSKDALGKKGNKLLKKGNKFLVY